MRITEKLSNFLSNEIAAMTRDERIFTPRDMENAIYQGIQAAYEAGEIAQREKIIKAVCTGCRLGWPEQGRPGHGIVIHVPPDPRGLYACQAVAIRALPLSGAEESKKEKA